MLSKTRDYRIDVDRYSWEWLLPELRMQRMRLRRMLIRRKDNITYEGTVLGIIALGWAYNLLNN